MEEVELEKTCEVCNVAMGKEKYISHVLKDHVTEFDVGICQIEKCFPCISKNDGIIIRCDPDGENMLDVDGASDSEESMEGDKFLEILNEDFKDPDAHLFLYARPGEKLHSDIKYKSVAEEPKPFTLIKPIAPAYKELPSWQQLVVSNIQHPKMGPVTVNQANQVAMIPTLTSTQKTLIPQIISRMNSQRPQHTYQRRQVPEVIEL